MNTLVDKNEIPERDILNSTLRISTIDSDNEYLFVSLNTARVLKLPLSNYPRLIPASREQVMAYRLIGKGMGIHWPELDEDLSLKRFLEDAGVGV